MTQRSDAIELAYGLLWMLPVDTATDDGARISRARKALLGLLNRDGQARGIASAKKRAAISNDLRRLIVAARIVAFSDQGPAAIKALDEASEAFADQVPWDDEPESAGAKVTVVGENR